MLTERQIEILNIITDLQPISGEEIGERLGVTRSALRTDFSLLKNWGYIDSKHRVGYVLTEKKWKRSEELRVRDIMSLPLSLDENISVYDAIKFMFEKDIGTLYLTKNGEISGVVSRKDLIKSAMGDKNLESIPLYLVMTRAPKLISVVGDDTPLTAARKLIENEIDSLPVVENSRIIGRVTKTNITKLFIIQEER